MANTNTNSQGSSSTSDSNGKVSNLLKLTFYSQSRLENVYNNIFYFERSSNSDGKFIQYNFQVRVDIKRLKLQAHVFAASFQQHGYLNLSKVLRVRDNEVYRVLSQAYIYSYFKALYNAFFSSTLNSEDTYGYAFLGHSRFYSLLKSSNFSCMKNDCLIQSRIELGTMSYRKKLFASLLSHFDFLKEFSELTPSFGLSPFIILKIEGYLNYLKDDYYSRRAFGQDEGFSINFDKAKFGKLSVVELVNDQSGAILKEEQYPLLNCMKINNEQKILFSEVGENHDLRWNASFYTCMSNFLCLSSSNDMSLLSKLYRTQEFKDMDFLVASEVFANTGVKCISNPGKNTLKWSKDSVPSIGKLLKYIDDTYDSISDIDISDIISAIERFVVETEIGTKGPGNPNPK